MVSDNLPCPESDAEAAALRAQAARRQLRRLGAMVAGSALFMGLSQASRGVPAAALAPGLLAALCGVALCLLSLRRGAWHWRRGAAALWLGTLCWMGCSAAFADLDRSLLVPGCVLTAALGGWLLGLPLMRLSLLVSLLGVLLLEGWGHPEPTGWQGGGLWRTAAGWVLVFGLSALLFELIFREAEQQLQGLAAARQSERAHRRHFERIAEQVPTLLSHWDRAQRCLWINPRYARALGLPPEQAIGRQLGELWGEPLQTLMQPLIARVLAGEVVQAELSLPLGDGPERRLQVHLVPEYAAGQSEGPVIGWFGQSRDVTRQHQQSQAVLESRQRWRLAVEVAGLIYWELERRSNQVRWASDDDAPGEGPGGAGGGLQAPRDWSDFCRQIVHPEDRAALQAAVEQAWDDGHLQARYRLCLPDGELQWASVRAQVMVEPGHGADPAGGAQRMIGVWQNITAAELARQAQAQSEARLQALLDNTPAVAVQQYDLAGQVLDWNPASQALFGLSRAQALGRSLPELLPGWGGDAPARVQWLAAFEQLRQGRAVPSFELGFCAPDGRPRWLLCSLFRLPVLDGQVRLVGMAVDISERRRAEEAVRELQQGLESAFFGSPTPARIFATDDFGHTLACNDALCALIGYSRDEIMACNIRELGLHVSEAARDQMLAQLQRDGHVEGREMVLRNRAGAERTVLIYMLPVSWQGQPAWQSQLVDITERKRAEEALGASRRLLERVVDAIPMGIFVKDRHSNYLLVNQWMADFMGRSKQELLEHTTALPVDEAVRRRSVADDEWVYQHRQTLVQPEVELAGPDGRAQPFHSVKIPLFDEAGELTGLLGVNRSIVEEKRAQAALRASERRLSLLFQDSPAALSVIGDDGLYLDVNRSWLRLFGYPAEQVIGCSSEQFGLFPSAQDRARLYESLRRDGGVDELEIALRRADGSLLVCVASGRTLDIEGQRSYLFGIVDISDQRRARQQMEQMNQTLEAAVAQRTRDLTHANQELTQALASLRSTQDELLRSEKHAALGRMVAGVAHELNTPIGNSVLVATTLRSEVEQFGRSAAQGLTRSGLAQHVGQTGEAVAMLLKNLSRAADLIASFKQVAADQTSLQRRRFELGELLREILQMHQPSLRQSGLQVQTRVAPGLALDSYPGPLGQVLVNLLSNAVEHGYEDMAVGAVQIEAESARSGWLRIRVRDQGRGMGPETLRRIFDPFYTTRLGRGGTGLGLAICQSLVTRVLGGQLHAESEPGRGSCFVLDLPCVAPVVNNPDLAALPAATVKAGP